jgi:imidazolonepropionase-like amidohydrolase
MMPHTITLRLLLAILCTANALWSQSPQIVAVRAGRLFDSRSGQLLTKQVVLVEGERITAVGPEDQVKIPSGSRVINLSQATVLPGLIDCHTHIFVHNFSEVENTREYRTLMALTAAQRDLWAGFTMLRDMSTHGGASGSLRSYADVDIRNAIERGVVQGPRLQVSTLSVGPTGFDNIYAPGVNLPGDIAAADSPWEARRVVREELHYGADWIKIHGDVYHSFRFVPPTGGKGWDIWTDPTFTFEEVQAIVDETHRHGHKVACHAFWGEGLQNCVKAGVDSVEHAVALNDDEQLADILLQKGIYLVLTIGDYWKIKLPGDLKATGGQWSLAAQQEKSARLAISKGIKIAFGSGAQYWPTGPLVHGLQAGEFEYMVKYGMTPARAIQSATTVAAEMLGWQDRIGSIEKGKYADMIAVSGDPLMDITELERVKFVMKGGEVVRNDIR